MNTERELALDLTELIRSTPGVFDVYPANALPAAAVKTVMAAVLDDMPLVSVDLDETDVADEGAAAVRVAAKVGLLADASVPDQVRALCSAVVDHLIALGLRVDAVDIEASRVVAAAPTGVHT